MDRLPAGHEPMRIALTGHSGAGLLLMSDHGRQFVRKQAGSEKQNPRLRLQCEKLQQAHTQGVPCPAVYRSGEDGGLFSFDMEYIPADSVAHALLAGRDLDWTTIVPPLFALVDRYRQTSQGTIPEAAFLTKLDSIAAACALNDTLTPCLDRIEGIIAQLKNRAWGGIPLSDCHGDLTLENILMRRDGQIVFIDFDVPEQSSWWLDLTKLFQDLHGHWCARHMILRAPESPESLTAHLALSRAAARLEPLLYRLIPKGQERIWPLVAFHLLRTIPYANDRAIAEYVLQRIDAVADGRL